MAHKYRQEDLASPSFLPWLSKPNLFKSSPILSRHSQSIISSSSMAAFFSLAGSSQTLARSDPDLTRFYPDLTRSSSTKMRSEATFLRSKLSIKGSNPCPSRSNPNLSRSPSQSRSNSESYSILSRSNSRMKSVRRSSTVETAETIIRIDALSFRLFCGVFLLPPRNKTESIHIRVCQKTPNLLNHFEA
jgi:hypothetical protein